MDQKTKTEAAGFFSKEYSKLKNYIRSYISDKSDYDAEDIIQDVALNLFSRVDFETPVENLAGYIYRAVRNKIIDLQRSKNRKKQTPMEEINDYEIVRNWISQIDEHQDPEFRELMLEKVFEAMEKLKPEFQGIIWATEFEGRTFQELSEELETPVGTLLSRKHRAIASLQKVFQKANPELMNNYY